MKCCVSTDVGTWTNWLTFEPDPDYSLDAGTGLLSPLSYKLSHAEFYVVLYVLAPPDAAAARVFRGFIQSPSKQLCRRYMRCTECPSSSFSNVRHQVISNSKKNSMVEPMCCRCLQKVIFNPHTSQSYEEVLADVENMLNIEFPPVTALYTATTPHVKVTTSCHSCF